ncbi:MAG: electron transfer flavoprotein subunit alpha/FixB family protein [Deltaproteobacteria bacterium]|nr:electron transfer flavoprotein subunit alpha/FixB family protein [Deltaproteobacteria bacterium]
MSSEFGVRSAEFKDIWIWVHSREGEVEEVTQGLAGEARRLLLESGGKGKVVAVAFGPVLEEELQELGAYGVDRVLFMPEEILQDYQSEVYALRLGDLIKKHHPAFFFMAHTVETADLAPRLAAALETGLVTRAMDVGVDDQGKTWAIRPTANGHLFEKIYFADQEPHILTMLPSVLSTEKIPVPQNPEMITIPFSGPLGIPQIKLLERIEALPEVMDLEEADMIIAAGRGVGRDEAFSIIHELAGALGGTVAGTRPLIDWKTLPFERQIGQTGKTVTPRLMIACGISGANEFTVGMEKSKLVMAIDTDPQARIFRFADLGVVGDVHQVLPLLIEAIQKMKEGA